MFVGKLVCIVKVQMTYINILKTDKSKFTANSIFRTKNLAVGDGQGLK